MPFFNLEDELAAAEDIVVRLDPSRGRSQLVAGESGQRAEVQAVDAEGDGPYHGRGDDGQYAQLGSRQWERLDPGGEIEVGEPFQGRP